MNSYVESIHDGTMPTIPRKNRLACFSFVLELYAGVIEKSLSMQL